MFLIMSAAYIDQELKSEFGKIPPSFLPLGNMRLFQHQLKSASRTTTDVFLSLPKSYIISELDSIWLHDNNVSIIRIPESLTLGASLIAALDIIESSCETVLHVLFGDTLINPLPVGENIVAISAAKDCYNWAIVTDDKMHWFKNNDTNVGDGDGDGDGDDYNKVVSGYFKFNQPTLLVKSIILSHGDFLNGLNRYHKEVGLNIVNIDNWLDFGHVHTYYESKSMFTTQRAFNDLVIAPKYIEKTSVNSKKIRAEANWFEQLPSMMRSYTPQYLGSSSNEVNQFCYRLEYLHHITLNELFVFAEIPTITWQKIINSCFDFIDSCRERKAPKDEDLTADNLSQLFELKTKKRLSTYCKEKSINLNQVWEFNSSLKMSLNELIIESEHYLPNKINKSTVIHGDFCFSNILYDFRTNRIKVIDPRGLTTDGNLTIYGDFRYDIAKLSHSVLGLYDWIIAGYFQLEVNNFSIKFKLKISNQQESFQKNFIKLVEAKYGLTSANLYAMQIHLFLSMLPLHADQPKRQKALLANAFHLYQLIMRFEK